MAVLNARINGAWVEVGAASGGAEIAYQDDAPDNPTHGMLWIDKDAVASSGESLLEAEVVVETATAQVVIDDLDGNAHGGYQLYVEALTDNANTVMNIDLNAEALYLTYNVIQASTTNTNAATSLVGSGGPGVGFIVPTTKSVIELSIPPNSPGVMFLDKYSSTAYGAMTGWYRLTNTMSNVTSVTLTCSSTYKFAAGSIFRLYRRK